MKRLYDAGTYLTRLSLIQNDRLQIVLPTMKLGFGSVEGSVDVLVGGLLYWPLL